VMLDFAILNAEAAAGIYRKPIETLAREIRYDPLPEDMRMGRRLLQPTRAIAIGRRGFAPWRAGPAVALVTGTGDQADRC
jgi:hypothetical protein